MMAQLEALEESRPDIAHILLVIRAVDELYEDARMIKYAFVRSFFRPVRGGCVATSVELWN